MKNDSVTKYRIFKQYIESDGYTKALNKLLVNGLYKHFTNYSNFLIKGNKYPQNIIFITGLAKSGTSWIANIFSSLDGFDRFIPLGWRTFGPLRPERIYDMYDLYPNIFNEFRHRLAVIKGHTWARPNNINMLKASGLKYLIPVRDPRDKIISQYWYIRNRPNHWDHTLACSKSLNEYITYKLNSGEYENQSIEWLRMWMKYRDNEKSIIIRYEDVLDNTNVQIRNALGFLEIECCDNDIRRIIEKNSVGRYSGRNRADGNSESVYRRGIYGEWKEVFDDQQKEMFRQIGEDTIEALGYEQTK